MRSWNFPRIASVFPTGPRRVVILQSDVVCSMTGVPTVLAAPCSASTATGPMDHEFEEPPIGFTEPPTVFVSIMQPFLKTDLERFEGNIGSEALELLLHKALALLGLASAVSVSEK